VPFVKAQGRNVSQGLHLKRYRITPAEAVKISLLAAHPVENRREVFNRVFVGIISEGAAIMTQELLNVAGVPAKAVEPASISQQTVPR